MKKNITLLVILLFSLCNAQRLNIKSSHSYEMERYGNIPVNLNVGGIDLSIPLFEQNFNSIGDFKLTLNYNSSGFIPNKKSNYVGQDWFLNFGGIISREINGVADDSDSSQDIFSSKGFLVGTRLAPKSNLDVYNGNYSTSYWKDHTSAGRYQYELKPDKFNFNFMGVSGYFYIGNDGNPIAVSEDMNLKIDISNLSNQQNYGCTPDNSEIVITDRKGTKYYFGGNHTNLEISYQMGNSKDPARPLPNNQGIYSINSWYLRKVEYPNNHKLEIEYLKYKKIDSAWEEPTLGGFCYLSTRPPIPSSTQIVEELFDFNKYVNQKNQRFSYNFNTGIVGAHTWGDGSSFSYQAPYFLYTLTKKVFPLRISIDGKELVSFNYTRFQSNDKNYQPLKLSNIEIKNQDVSLKKIDFDYYRNKDRFFLTTITFPDNKKYTFDYYNKENLPKETTLGIDFWGFWNGQDEDNNYLIPQYLFNADTGDYQITGTSRNPNPNLVNTGLLKVVNYPTGGNSMFSYEPHTYSKKLERDFSSDFFPYVKSNTGTVGGARISKIIDSDGVSTSVRDFKYVKNYGSESTESSGVATQILRYMSYIDYANTGSGRTQVLTETANNISENSLNSSPISYSEVAELKNNILQKKYYFSNYSTNPDTLIERNNVVESDDVKPYKLIKNFFIRYNSNDHQRGKLLKMQIFNNGEIIKEVENNYTSLSNHPLLLNRYFTRVQQDVSWIHYQKEFVNPYVVSSTTARDYMNANAMVTKTDYFYEGSHLNATKEKVIYPSGEIYETKYQYAHEKGNQLMINKNMIGIPLETTSIKTINSISTILSKNETIYPLTQTEADTQTAGLVIPNSQKSYNIQDNSLSTDITYDRYDNKGNLIQYTTKDGATVGVVWGYNKTLPIAKIEGKDTVYFMNMFTTDNEALSNESNKDVDSATEEQFRAKLDIFQSRQNTLNVSITTYTHNPMIGITSIIPPSRIREIFIYDSSNRLKEVRQNNATGNLLKEYKYNYKN